MTMTERELADTLARWIDNARRSIRAIQADLSAPDPVNPITDAARIADHFAKIEAWNAVLRTMGHDPA